MPLNIVCDGIELFICSQERASCYCFIARETSIKIISIGDDSAKSRQTRMVASSKCSIRMIIQGASCSFHRNGVIEKDMGCTLYYS